MTLEQYRQVYKIPAVSGVSHIYINGSSKRVNCIYTAIYALKEDIDSLYEYMRVLSTQQVNPLIMSPDILQEVLDQVREGIRSNTRLTLSEDPSRKQMDILQCNKSYPNSNR